MARTKHIKRVKSGSGLARATMPLSNNLAISSSNNEKGDSSSGSEEKTRGRKEEDTTTDSEDYNRCVLFVWGY